ncbi:MAG: hypothetical protein IAE87_18505 [Rhodobacteraceae bacterium]|jgi:hypothetical protein|nr:hypothetical protein [Paracoccaceae bacterium]
MAKVVLHIGTHKTATTTIQDMFAHNAALLAEHGVIYPRLGRAAGHHGLVADWNRWLQGYAVPGGSLARLTQLASEHAGGEATVFLSSEEFSRAQPGARVDFAAVRAALAAFDEIEIVCVLREQWQFIQSIYLEISRTRVPPRPPQFIEMARRENMVEGLWTDYNLLYDHLLASFAPEEITFLDYDACRRAEGGILGRLLSHLGTSLTAADLAKINAGHSNTSPPALPTWAANITAEPHRATPWLVDAMTGAFAIQFGKTARSVLWSRDELTTLRAYAAEHNARLAARLAAVQPDFALGESVIADGTIHREDLRPEFWQRCNRWIFAIARKLIG